MDIERTGIEATLGYFLSSTLSISIRLITTHYSLDSLTVVLIRGVLTLICLLAVAYWKRANFSELTILAALIIVGFGTV